MATVQWINLLVFQANMLYKLPIAKFLRDLAKVLAEHPALICFNEVSHRHKEIAAAGAEHGYFVHHPQGPGEYDGVALLLLKSRFFARYRGVKQMHKEPPGKPTARYCSWVISWDLLANRPVIFMGTHTLAAVERGNKLNPILRTKFYIQHIKGLITLAIDLRRLCKQKFGRPGHVILVGDMNWSWTPQAWIAKMLCGYFVSSHLACKPRVNTLGHRRVDVVLKRGGYLKFVRHFVISLFSDHNGYGVYMKFKRRPGPLPSFCRR